MTKQISIIVPNLHSPIIDRTLNAIRRQTMDLSPVEVIVVGRDRFKLVQEDALVTFLDPGYPVSPAVARNLGLSRATGKIVVFLDADCIAAEDWLENLTAAYEEDPGRTVVGGAVDFDSTNYWTLCDNISTFHPFLSTCQPGERSHLPSLNFSARRDALRAVGGFDERYPRAAGEDTDLSLRLRKAGHTLYFEPRALVHHHPSRGSLGALLRHARDFGRYSPRLRAEYADLIDSPAFLRRPGALLGLAPLLAAGVTARIFLTNPTLRRYWYTAPALFLAKLAWCIGAIRPHTIHGAACGLQDPETWLTHGPHVAAIVLNWNRRDDTLECLTSLHAMVRCSNNVRRLDLILIDNGSTDDTAEMVHRQFPSVNVISLSQNLGFAAGSNIGIRRALDTGADYVLLVNNDAMVAPDMLDRLVEIAETRPDAGLLSPVIYYFSAPERVWSAGYRQRPVTLSAQPPARHPDDDTPYPVDRLYGAGLLIRRRVLEEVGLFDERFYMYYEDADLCRRVQDAGYTLLVVPTASMWHKVSASTGEGSPLQMYYLARSSVLFFAKHTPLLLSPILMAYRIGVAIKKLLLSARRRQWGATRAYLRGLVDGLRLLRTTSDPTGESHVPTG